VRGLAAALWLLVLLPCPVAAHAVLVEARPADGQQLDQAPAELTLRFSEPVVPISVRLEAGLRASDVFTVRRAQIVLLSAEGRWPREIARGLRCAVQTVRNGIRAFNANGVASLVAASLRPKSATPVLGEAERERLRAILHQPPRAFGHARSTWTLDLLARTAYAEGLSGTVLSAETVRQALLRLKVGWKRAKRWLTSPDPAYAQKNAVATG
jgi:transposase